MVVLIASIRPAIAPVGCQLEVRKPPSTGHWTTVTKLASPRYYGLADAQLDASPQRITFRFTFRS
jgi:hypothetical protein